MELHVFLNRKIAKNEHLSKDCILRMEVYGLYPYISERGKLCSNVYTHAHADLKILDFKHET